jgi:hypothetical protein
MEWIIIIDPGYLLMLAADYAAAAKSEAIAQGIINTFIFA